MGINFNKHLFIMRVTRCESQKRQPLRVSLAGSLDHRRERRLQLARDGTWLAGADGDLVDLAHRGDLAGRAGEEDLAGRVQHVARESLFHHLDPVLARQRDDRIARDAVQDGHRQRRGVQAAAVDHENVLAGALGHRPGGVQHDGLVVPHADHLTLGQHGIHVLTGDLGLAHGVVEVTTHKGGQVGADALVEGLGAQIRPPGEGDDDELDWVVA